MRLLVSGFTTAETTFAGSTAVAGDLTVRPAGTIGKATFKVEKIVVVCGGSTVAANSSGGVKFNYGETSGALVSTIVFPTPFGGGYTSVATPPGGTGPMVVELDGLGIHTNSFVFETNEAAHGGWSAFVFGE